MIVVSIVKNSIYLPKTSNTAPKFRRNVIDKLRKWVTNFIFGCHVGLIFKYVNKISRHTTYNSRGFFIFVQNLYKWN